MSLMSKLKEHLSENTFLRLFLAVYCPPVAVCDKGCFVFSVVFFLFFMQISCLCYALALLFSSLGASLFAGSTSGTFYNWAYDLTSLIPEDWPIIIAGCVRMLGFLLIMGVLWVIVIMLFDFLIGFFSILFHIPAALIAVLACLFTDNNKKALVPHSTSDYAGLAHFSWKNVREVLLILNRIILCFFFPPLAVADMGLRKMLLVCLLSFCGWIPGTITVFFLVLRQYNTKFQTKKKGAV